jgi:hypothetical protein
MINRIAVSHADPIIGADRRDLRHPLVEWRPTQRLRTYALFHDDSGASAPLAKDVHPMAVDIHEPARRGIPSIVPSFHRGLIGPTQQGCGENQRNEA